MFQGHVHVPQFSLVRMHWYGWVLKREVRTAWPPFYTKASNRIVLSPPPLSFPLFFSPHPAQPDHRARARGPEDSTPTTTVPPPRAARAAQAPPLNKTCLHV